MITPPAYAMPADPDRSWMLGHHGPVCVPAQRQQWDPSTRTHTVVDMQVHQPGLYGRWFPIDMDANNRHAVDQWCERNPGQPRPMLGWSICRHGFGREDEGRRGRELGRVLTEADADAWAIEMNATIKIGEPAR